MNRYYLSIFDRLGYEVLNPNQAELHLLFIEVKRINVELNGKKLIIDIMYT